jgi:hypothetical protein
MARLLSEFARGDWPLDPIITPLYTMLVPDEPKLIQKYIVEWCDSGYIINEIIMKTFISHFELN